MIRWWWRRIPIRRWRCCAMRATRSAQCLARSDTVQCGVSAPRSAADAEAKARLGVLEFPPRGHGRGGRRRRRHHLLDELLQGIDTARPLFVSLNPPFEPKPDLTFARFNCDHPQFDAAPSTAQKRLDDDSGREPDLVLRSLDRIWFSRRRICVGTRRCAGGSAARFRGAAQAHVRGGRRMNQDSVPSPNRCRNALSRRCHACASRAGRSSLRYRVLNLLIDLDRLEEADSQSRLFAVKPARASIPSTSAITVPAMARPSPMPRGKAKAEGIDLTGGRYGCSAIRACSATSSIRSRSITATDADGSLALC